MAELAMSPRIFVDSLRSPLGLSRKVAEALSFLQWESLIPENARVFVKPNLTWRSPLPGVTNTPEFIEACVQVLRQRTSHVVVGESDGGYHGFRAEEAFASHRLYDLARRYDIQVVNLSKQESESVSGTVAGRYVKVDLPKLLLHDVDVFLTLPVPKVHAATTVSLALKNQWGCIPSPMRLHHHAQFARKIILINRALRTRIALFDAKYMLNRTGPMIGDSVATDLLLAADDPGAGSLACCRLMGVNPWSVPHHRIALREGMMPDNLDRCFLNQPLEPFCGQPFYLRRNFMNWVSVAAFHSEVLTQLMYDSAFADISHRVLYSIRRHRLAARILYGRLGPPEIEGSRKA
jgi:uncharacterized protein (DUF362 family)